MPDKDIQKRRDYNNNYLKVRMQDPEYRKMRNEKNRIRSQTPDGMAKRRAYQRTDKRKALQKVKSLLYQQTDKYKVLRIASRSTDEAKASVRERSKAITAKSRSRPNGHDLYVMQCDSFPGLYKIGCAADPHYRATILSSGFFDKVEVAKVYEGFGKHEKLVHEALTPFMHTTPKKPKTEWFRLPYEELVEKINSVISQFEH